MAEDFTINADIEKVSKALNGTTKEMKSIIRGVLGIVGRGTRQEVNKVTRAIKGNGMIAGRYPYSVAKSFMYKVAKDGSKVSVFPRKIEKGRKNDLTIPVISTLNYGKVIYPRRGRNYLVFPLQDGSFLKVKSVRITGRHFVEAGKNYAVSSKYMSDVDKYIQKS